MSNKLYNESSIQNIANAIRAVNGSTDRYKVGDMASAIENIATGLNWTELNYDTTGPNKGVPEEIISGFNYAKNIINTYTVNSTYIQDEKLLFFPNIDITGRYNYQQLFDRSNLLHIEPILVGQEIPLGTITLNNAFKETLIESIEISSINDAEIGFASCFLNAKNLKTAKINSPAVNITSMFEGCTSLISVNEFDTSNSTSSRYCFKNCSSLVTAPDLDLSSSGPLSEFFNGCTSLVNGPDLDTTNCNNTNSMFNNCTSLVNVPVYITNSVTDARNMFSGCTSLSDSAVNNILIMCANMTNYAYTKKLHGSNSIGLPDQYDSIISTLSNYQTFIDAGWSIS